MCLASVYKIKGTERDGLLEEVASIKADEGKLLLRTLFGEELTIEATIREIDFVNSTVLIEEGRSVTRSGSVKPRKGEVQE